MVNRYIVFGCGNLPGKGVSLHEIPAIAKTTRRQKWKGFVKCTRAGWNASSDGTRYICSKHFKQGYFINWTKFTLNMCDKLIFLFYLSTQQPAPRSRMEPGMELKNPSLTKARNDLKGFSSSSREAIILIPEKKTC